ncbi:hypothetical protein FD03_GL000627 [Companilactobacillus nodensis DSM 19682 = JCM 14932 = NBRC 107160]|uniref:SHOCT domain-containing protein n=2 Tax=Companilactobacillus nodensis TaxID=460870 RepID=A0A0R1K777_9LACO|nr:hypothetical protein FD03_GL000627 [Companilactobacillus nodensis DSM 19682 = JCM 14932 = NBRC 107160]
MGEIMDTSNEIFVKHPGKTIINYDNEKVVITRKGTLNFMTQGIKGSKTIPIKSITSIQLKKPGMTNGYIQFGVLGGNESNQGVLNATQDENTVMFSKKYYNEMTSLKENIEKIMFENNNKKSNSSESVADELLKLKQLLDSDVLSQEEFDQQKEKLLSN